MVRFEGRRRPRSGPNLTPLVDVVFLLLLFFMLTSHFVQEEAIDLNLPEAQSGGPGEEILQIVLAGDGRIMLAEEEVLPEDLTMRLTLALRQRSEKTVGIRGDKSVSLETTVSVLDAARQAGAESVAIVTVRP